MSMSKIELMDVLKAQGTASYDLDLIERAYDEAYKAHEGQKRLTGEPYFVHPYNVALIVAKLGMDSESIAAALLHDTVEDTGETLEQVRTNFGDDVALIVDGVTKLGRVSTKNKEEQQAENVRKMLLAMAEDIRVIIIKLADRLHNMRTLDAQSNYKQLEKALETIEIYAPIAHRLGIRALKEELEDLSLRYLDPVAYEEIENLLKESNEKCKYLIESVKNKLSERLKEAVSGMEIEGRVKSVYGIYRKMFIQNKQFSEIFDIYAIRVIVDSVIDCYNVLGVVHDMYKLIPGRFKDYISTPKPNMYQSLHTTVLGSEKIPFEVQIRTFDMHHTAEFGIAAHWKYKDGISKNDIKFEERLSWIRQLLESQKDADDVEDIVRTIKTDLASDEVFGVTPKGDIISLPNGSTVIDFAYAIHTAVGNRMVGAKINGRIVPIDYKIKTGEVIEVLTASASSSKGPSRDWLNIVKTNEAKTKIRSWFKKEKYSENVERGKAEFDREFARMGINLQNEESTKFIKDIALRFKCEAVDDFYAKIGYGGVQMSNVLTAMRDEYNKIKKANEAADISTLIKPVSVTRGKDNKNSVIVDGIDDCLIKLSKCCNPLPGDDIIGFITRGHGVSIHKKECTNIPKDIQSCDEPDRYIGAHWGNIETTSFSSNIQVLAFDRAMLLADITTALAGMRVIITAVNARETKDGNCAVDLTIRVESTEHLKSIMNRISKINGVYSVERFLN